MSLAIYSAAAFSLAGEYPVPAANALIEVRREDNGALATIYSDVDGTIQKSNPFNADSSGRFSFYAAGLERGYKITVTYGGSETYTLRNQAVGTAGEMDATAYMAQVFASANAAAARTALDVIQSINALTAETTPATADEVALYDASAAAYRKMTLLNLMKIINALTAETAPATGDLLALYDVSANATDKITLSDLFKIINGFAADSSPDFAADYVATYDASAAGPKKVLLGTIVTAAARKNAIINGHMQIWQRGTSFSSAATGTFSADRWEYIKIGTMVHSLTQSSDVPTVAQAGVLFPYSLLVDCTTAAASLAATDVCYIRHKIEGYNWLPLSQRAVTLSFWVKATKTGTYCIAATNSGQDRTYVGEYTVSAANTWEKKIVTLAASPNPVTEGTWNHGRGTGLELRFALAAGSNFRTTAGAWQTGNYLATPNQVNACDSTNNNFYITGVQLEAGSVATAFDYRTYQEELVLCQRYYEKSYDYATAPGTPSPDGARYTFAINIQQFYDYARVDFKVTKRVTPTTTIYSTSGASGQMRNLTTSTDTAAVTDTSGENGFNVISPGSALTPNHLYGFHWASNAEL